MVEPRAAPATSPAAAGPAAAQNIPALVRPAARVGLFGGAFDPVHLGHLAVARAALRELALDHLFFVPAAQAPLRDGPAAASADDRLDLLARALAAENDPRLGLLDLEARAGGVHFTVDTVRRLQSAWPQARLFWLLGGDQFAQLDHWREPRALARLVEFAVLDRPGSPAAPPPALADALRWQRLSGETHPARAADIRRRRRAGEPWALELPPPVAAAIEARGLYMTPGSGARSGARAANTIP